jgi:hypothetical protein
VQKTTFGAAFLGALTAASLAFGAGDVNGSRGADGGGSSSQWTGPGQVNNGRTNAAQSARARSHAAASRVSSQRTGAR